MRTANYSPIATMAETTSLNYSLAKVLAILTVVAGHWFVGTILWVPVTFGLIIFAFSSAYFTAKMYGVQLDRKRFWRRKLERLGLRFWVILLFLSIVLAFKGKTVLHWHSAVHFLGLSGALNWLAVPNRSGLGAGLWFFTLLLIFYIAYPFLARLSESKSAGKIIAVTSLVFAVVLHETVKVGHELWLTSLGFIVGVVYGLHEPKAKPNNVAAFGLSCCALLVWINTIGSAYKHFNAVLIALASLSVCVWLSCATVRVWTPLRQLARLEKYLLEIFLIHGSLFVRPSGNTVADFLLSVCFIVVSAAALNWAIELLSSRVFERRGKVELSPRRGGSGRIDRLPATGERMGALTPALPPDPGPGC